MAKKNEKADRLDVQNLTPTQMVRLINSTALGPAVNPMRLHKQMNTAGMRIASSSDNRRVNLLRYVSWLANEYDPRTFKRPVKQTYADRIRRDLDRKLEASRVGRDIGPPPEVVDMERRKRCGESFRSFCETYFPAAFSLAWSNDHLKIIAKIERAVKEGGLFAFAMPRGSGKTTLARVAGMWAVLYGFRVYVCIIGSAAEQALNLLESIKRDLLTNDRLHEDFPEVTHPIRRLENNARRQIGQLCCGESTYITWSADKLVLPTLRGEQLPMSLRNAGYDESPSAGAVITVAGLDSNIRGQHHTKLDGSVERPSLVICDDPQTRQSAASVSQTRHRLSILNGDVLGMAGPKVKIAGFMTVTKIYHDDLADQILDRKKNPEWQGETTKMVYAFPAPDSPAAKLWDEYATLRAEGLREGDGGKAATEFYRARQAEMDAGTQVAWPARFNPDELSALQHAMNLKLRDEEAFYAEYQNEPLVTQVEEGVVTPDQVAQKINGRPRKEAPKEATCVTAFIDVQEKMLFYAVCAWTEDFTGYVLDYGTYPDQLRRYFTLRESARTMAAEFPGAGVEGVIHAGLEKLAGELLHASWPVTAGGEMRIDRLLIDSGYLPGVIGSVCHKLGAGGAVLPSKGVGIKAGNKPMAAYQRHPGEKYGWHWYMPNVNRTNEFKHVLIDTNHWKTFIHARFAVAAGDKGSLSLFGKSPAEHRLLADHVAAAETWTRTEGHGRTVQEWNIKPSKPDNHWFDCLVGCAVGASMQGVALPGTQVVKAKTRPLRLSAEQAKRMGV